MVLLLLQQQYQCTMLVCFYLALISFIFFPEYKWLCGNIYSWLFLVQRELVWCMGNFTIG